ncbi:TerC/Alx family metal homeostasis membrane protein [Nocardioides terrisoli]|uniref:TerC/Alx family metal homeostasis membrane protein n=1 Tax=Nocardioides terrisoli TaxID=3388267 RepID=UPI00287B99E3|nr:TerC/Alx family metal homeostasis membrane protein [Nocardioides marmorisolisilvae]
MFTAVPLVAWLLTILGLLAIVGLDLVVIARRRREITVSDAARWVVLYVGLAVAFGVVLLLWGPPDTGSQFFAGYVTEYSLSVDNLFVFVIIMARFAVPPLAVDKTLYIGIVLSLLMRAVFIVAGAAAIAAATWTFYVFGAFLVYTAVKLVLEGENDEADFQEGRLLRRLRRVLPLTADYHGDRIVVRAHGRRMATPLAIAIAAIGVANVVFALDSIPAIFGLTQDTFVVLTANAFALMGLRQLYFLIGGLLGKIVYLNVGLSVILAFVGVKLLVEALHGSGVDHLGAVGLPEITTGFSLMFILVVLGLTIAASLARDAWQQRLAWRRGSRGVDVIPAARRNRDQASWPTSGANRDRHP